MSFCVVASHRVASFSVASHGSRSIAPHALLHRVEHASSSMRVASPHRMPAGRTHAEGSFRCTLPRLRSSFAEARSGRELELLRKPPPLGGEGGSLRRGGAM